MGCNVSQTVEFAVANSTASGSHDVSQNPILLDSPGGKVTGNLVSGSNDVSHNSMGVDNSNARCFGAEQAGNPATVASGDVVEDNARRTFNLEEAKQRLKQLKVSSPQQTTVQADYNDTGIESQSLKFAGRSVHDLLVVEIFAGSARLTKACKGLGLRAVAVDKTSGRSEGPHIFHCDVTDPEDYQALVSFLEAEKDSLAWAHFAPACGTASKAREKKQHKLEREGFKMPQPLRSEDYPLGLPGLTGVDKLRTETANLVYEACANLIKLLASWGVCCTVENPSNSLFWCVPCIVELVDTLGGYDCIFDNCCHGGQRKKSSTFWCTQPWFQSLQAQCPGDDVHRRKPWKPSVVEGKLQFPTAEEAAYPTLLCVRLAELCRNQLLSLGAIEPEDLEQQQKVESMSTHRIVLSALPRGKKFKPLVSEYGSYITTLHAPTVVFPEASLPPGAKLVHQRVAKWGAERVDDNFIVHDSLHNVKQDDQILVSQFGVPRCPMDFLQRAVQCGHPRGSAIHITPEVKKILQDNISMDAASLAVIRCRELTKWTARAAELREREKTFKNTMPGHLRKLLASKRLLLFGEMLESVGYPDRDLIKDIAAGFKLVGWQKPTGVFPSCVKRPQFDLETLRKMAPGLNRSIVGQLNQEDDSDPTVVQTWEKTQEEVSLGYIWPDPDSKVEDVLIAKRFGLLQRAGKLRVIDDCSIGGLNGTLGTREKCRIHAIDECAAYLAHMLDLNLVLAKDVKLKGRTFDMKSAYKQYGISSEDRALIRLAVRNPVDHCISLFGVNSLPFGASGSVGGFLRISMAVWYIGLVIFKLPWTAYFDDYTVFSQEELCSSTTKTVIHLFDLLGIDFARSGDKAMDFSDRFRSLGVEVVLDNFKGGVVEISHTSERCRELQDTLGEILKAGVVSPKLALSLWGRMHWFESFTFGRVANGAVKVLGDISSRRGREVTLTNWEVSSIRFLMERVVVAPPLKIMPSCLKSWLVFTDGACEGPEGCKQGSIGGVLVNPDGTLVSFFGGLLPDVLMQSFMAKSRNPIYELEVLPVFVASMLWGKAVRYSQVCWYLDNEAARSACIKAYGATCLADALVSEFIRIEMSHQLKSWFGRVPSVSKIADAPSRCEDSFLRDHGADKVQIDWDAVGRVVFAGSS